MTDPVDLARAARKIAKDVQAARDKVGPYADSIGIGSMLTAIDALAQAVEQLAIDADESA